MTTFFDINQLSVMQLRNLTSQIAMSSCATD